MRTLPSTGVRFGTFELDLNTGELRSAGAPDPDSKDLLREQVFHVLRMLVEREGQIVTRDEIKERLWPDDTTVDFDSSINATIKTLRRALGDSADSPRYVETLARRGYRLIPAVEHVGSAPRIALAEIHAEVHPTKARRLRAWVAVVVAIAALSVWRYEAYRHRITLA